MGDRSLFAAIDEALGPSWRAIVRGPLPAVRQPARSSQRSYFVAGEAPRRPASRPVVLDREVVAPDTDRFFASALYGALNAGELVVEVAQLADGSWSEVTTKRLSPAFWPAAKFAIRRNPPRFAEYANGKWRDLANPMVLQPAAVAADRPKHGAKRQAILADMAQHHPNLAGLGTNEAARFLEGLGHEREHARKIVMEQRGKK